MDYTKIIFVSKENVLLGPMAEWIMKSILMDKSKQIMSRGLVVLFAEPRDQRVTELLMNHGVPCEEQVSEEFHAEQVDETTLVLTMNFTEKTGKLVTIKSVTDENDLMIINKSGITIRLKVADVRIMGRATQGVRLINLEKRNDQIGSGMRHMRNVT